MRRPMFFLQLPFSWKFHPELWYSLGLRSIPELLLPSKQTIRCGFPQFLIGEETMLLLVLPVMCTIQYYLVLAETIQIPTFSVKLGSAPVLGKGAYLTNAMPEPYQGSSRVESDGNICKVRRPLKPFPCNSYKKIQWNLVEKSGSKTKFQYFSFLDFLKSGIHLRVLLPQSCCLLCKAHFLFKLMADPIEITWTKNFRVSNSGFKIWLIIKY